MMKKIKGTTPHPRIGLHFLLTEVQEFQHNSQNETACLDRDPNSFLRGI